MTDPKANPLFSRLASVMMLATALVCLGCASSGSRGGSNQDVITREMIQNSSASTVLQLIQRERPRWLQRRGGITAGVDDAGVELVPIAVYLDHIRFGTADDLTSLSTHGITEVQWLSARDATQRFGTGHSRGAILVSTRP